MLNVNTYFLYHSLIPRSHILTIRQHPPF